MKKNIHPEYHQNAKIICACGNTFTVGSTVPEIHIEICSACHPFYTGKQKLVDTARRVEKFQERAAKQKVAATARKGRKVKKQRATKAKAPAFNKLPVGRKKKSASASTLRKVLADSKPSANSEKK